MSRAGLWASDTAHAYRAVVGALCSARSNSNMRPPSFRLLTQSRDSELHGLGLFHLFRFPVQNANRYL
jgi:hypothetical protein